MPHEDDARRALLRILDANRNRALEALRVVEEHARFVLAAEELARRTKDLRHRLHLALEVEPLRDLTLHRDVETDPLRPTTEMKTEGPRAVRSTSEDVVRANFSRAKEALRALEEYAKPLAPGPSAEVERVRYAVYTLERDLVTKGRSQGLLAGRSVYVLLEERDGRPSLEAMARAAVAGGARLFQLRDKRSTDRTRLEKATRLAALLAESGAVLIVNDRPDLAVLSGAQGVHLGQDDLPADQARRLLRPEAIVGCSAHDAPELERVLAWNPDYLGVGTIFPSPTKPDLVARGLAILRELVPRATVPVYAIGGIDASNAASAIEAGASGVAVSSSVLDRGDIEAAVRALVLVVDTARRQST